MGDGHLIPIRMLDPTTLVKTACAFYHPEMLAELTAGEAHMELLGPENKESIQVVHTKIGVAIVPAIDQSQRLVMPVPFPTAMHTAIHRNLHAIKIIGLILEHVIINVWVERPQQNWNMRAHCMHGLFAAVVESCKILR